MTRLTILMQIMRIRVDAGSVFDTLYLQSSGGVIKMEHSVRKSETSQYKMLDMVEVTMIAPTVISVNPAFN